MLGCADGVDALQKLKEGARPSLILLDLMMPRMNGRQFRELQRNEPAFADIPTVLMTASRNVDGIAADAVIFKPLEFNQLLDIVRRHCG
jgi:CheY-like chemotaxis protein